MMDCGHERERKRACFIVFFWFGMFVERRKKDMSQKQEREKRTENELKKFYDAAEFVAACLAA